MTDPKPRFFATPARWRAWLAKNHDARSELWVGFHKKGSGKPSITWPESVDEALCYGWIDGVRKSIDETSYKIRFTPRRPTSIWSAVNVGRMEVLSREGRVQPSGAAAYRTREDRKSRVYSYEQRQQAALSPEYRKTFKQTPAAWAFYQRQAPWYRRTSAFWVMSAKREETRQRRLEALIADSAAGRAVKPLSRKK